MTDAAFSNSESELFRLTGEWRAAKASETDARDHRLRIEAEIAALADLKAEGITKIPGDLSVKTGNNRKWDASYLELMEAEIAPEFFPFTKAESFKEDKKKAEAIRSTYPDLWDRLSKGLTVEPAKPAFTDKRK